jgi:membrane protein required for colicin V production
LAAVFLHPWAAGIIRKNMMPNLNYIPEVLGFIAVFLAVLLICKIIERILKNIIEGVTLGPRDKILGAGFGLLEGLAITALFLFVLVVQPVFDTSKLIAGSFFAQILLPHIGKIRPDSGSGEIVTAMLNLQSFIFRI